MKGNAGALWQVEVQGTRMFRPKVNEPGQGRFLLYAGERLQCLDATSNGALLWERFLHPQPKEVFFCGDNAILVYTTRFDVILVAFNLKDGRRSWDLELLRGARWYGRTGDSFFIKDNSDRFTMVDLIKGEIVGRTNVPRRNGQAFAHFGGTDIHLVRAVQHLNQPNALYWLTWNTKNGEVIGQEQRLKGLLGKPDEVFNNCHLHTARFGRKALYFLATTRHGDQRRGTIYRGDYHDRSVHMVRYDARLHDLKSPFFLFQDEGRQREIKDKHAWVIHREDNPSYEYQLDLSRHAKVTLLDEAHLLEAINQKPKTLRVHQLASKKVVINHVTEDPERLDAVRFGSRHLAVFEFRRNQYFRVTPYNIESGLAGKPMEIDYWAGNHEHPSAVYVAGNLLLVANRNFLQAWKVDEWASL